MMKESTSSKAVKKADIKELELQDSRLYEICFYLADFLEGREGKTQEINEFVRPYARQQARKIEKNNLFQCLINYILKKETLGSNNQLSFYIKRLPEKEFGRLSSKEVAERKRALRENIEKNEKVALFLMDFMTQTCSHKGASRDVDNFYRNHQREFKAKQLKKLMTFLDRFHSIGQKHLHEYFEKKDALKEASKQTKQNEE